MKAKNNIMKIGTIQKIIWICAFVCCNLFMVNAQDTLKINTIPAGKTILISFDVTIVDSLEDRADSIISSQVIIKGDSTEGFYSYDPEVFYFDSAYPTLTYLYIEEIEDTTENPVDTTENPVDTTIFVKFLVIENLTVFPNPNKGNFRLSFEVNSTVPKVSIYLINMLGVALYKEELYDFGGNYDKQIDNIQFSPGIYILRVSGNGISKRKIISVYRD